MLVTAGDTGHFNTMTASWGGFGVLWNKSVVWCVIRPQRYTREFIDTADNFTLTFFSEDYRDALWVCGTKSGRDCNKVAESGLTPIAGSIPNTTLFSEARIIMECRKIYTTDIDPLNFVDPDIDSNYPDKDYHRMYFGEILRCAVK